MRAQMNEGFLRNGTKFRVVIWPRSTRSYAGRL